ncbi:hypothetical protein JTB14_023880 [Gonioctena quinquepunctata]|nr:hypothetical protein JTB14_023880 [Gonioctena quinquepunctata]
MIYSIFQNIDIDILVCSLPLEDNQQTRETTVHDNEEISRRENEQPIICTNTTNTAYKVTIQGDHILEPNEEYSIPIISTCNNERDLIFIMDEDFLIQHGLICEEEPQYPNIPHMIVRNMKHYKIKLLQGMSIGWLKEWTDIPVDNAIVLYGTSIEEEEVTIEDHQIKHITDEIFKRSLSNLLEEYKDVFSKSDLFSRT